MCLYNTFCLNAYHQHLKKENCNVLYIASNYATVPIRSLNALITHAVIVYAQMDRDTEVNPIDDPSTMHNWSYVGYSETESNISTEANRKFWIQTDNLNKWAKCWYPKRSEMEFLKGNIEKMK